MRDSVKKMEKIKNFRQTLFVLFFLAFMTFPYIQAAHSVVTKRMWSNLETGYALDGYDAVAYFTDAVPRKGTAEFEYVWQGVAWQFVNGGNMDAFIRNPEVYAPQFGGYGAAGVFENRLLSPNPLHWGLYQKKLYLFHSAKAKLMWEMDVDKKIPVARENWEMLLKNLNE